MATKKPNFKDIVKAEMANRDLPVKEEYREEMAALRDKNMLAQMQALAQAQVQAQVQAQPEALPQVQAEVNAQALVQPTAQALAQVKAETLVQAQAEVPVEALAQAETKLSVEKLKSQVDAKKVKFQVGKKQRTIWMTYDTINKIDELCKRTDKSMYEIVEVAVNNLYAEVLKK